MRQITQFITGASIATGLIFGGLALSEARAAEANWKTTEYWNIAGDSKAGYCRAEVTFSDKLFIGIAQNTDGWVMVVGAPNSLPMEKGTAYTLDVVLEGGMSGKLTGTAIDTHMASFTGLTPQFVADFAYAPSITVGNIGTFNLKGSLEAILETHACFKAVTGTAEASTPTRRA